MSKHTYLVTVEAKTAEQAGQVMVERIYHDEEYGFDYRIDFQSVAAQPYTVDDAVRDLGKRPPARTWDNTEAAKRFVPRD